MRRAVLMLARHKTLIAWIALYQSAGFAIGAFTSADTGAWYQTLEKSFLTPPDFVFPIAWTILYVLIALAGWNIWKHRDQKEGRIALTIFALYTALNWGWSFVFFTFHLIKIAYIWIVVMNGVNAAFIVYGWSRFREAAVLMVLPLVWTCFAAYLSYAIWMLNS